MHVDLVTRVYKLILEANGARIANRFIREFDHLASHAMKNYGTQAALNHYWNIVLGLLNIDTTYAREALINGVSEETWIINFSKYVMPLVIQWKLPREEQ